MRADGRGAQTYVDAAARVAIKQTGVVEYLQGNLLTEGVFAAFSSLELSAGSRSCGHFANRSPLAATRTKAFTLPETHGGPSKSFDIVFDFTGESDFELPEVVRPPSPTSASSLTPFARSTSSELSVSHSS